jgi:hypothetical protein
MTTADYTLSAGFNVDNIRIEAAAPPTANFTANKTTVCKYYLHLNHHAGYFHLCGRHQRK